MKHEVGPFQQFPRARMFTREILVAAAITFAAFLTFFGSQDAPEYASTETPAGDVSPQ